MKILKYIFSTMILTLIFNTVFAEEQLAQLRYCMKSPWTAAKYSPAIFEVSFVNVFAMNNPNGVITKLSSLATTNPAIIDKPTSSTSYICDDTVTTKILMNCKGSSHDCGKDDKFKFEIHASSQFPTRNNIEILFRIWCEKNNNCEKGYLVMGYKDYMGTASLCKDVARTDCSRNQKPLQIKSRDEIFYLFIN